MTSKQREEFRKRQQQRAQQQRALIIGGIVLVAVAIVGFLIYQNIPRTVSTTDKNKFPFANGKTLGQSEAKVLIQEFTDFQCPFCRQFATDIEPQLIEDYIQTGKARFEYHHFIVIDGKTGGNESRRAAEASECANEQGLFWEYHETLFANQGGEGGGAFSEARLRGFAQTLGLDIGKFDSCLNSSRYASALVTDEQLARTLGTSFTPSVYVNGTLAEDPFDYNALRQMIEAELAK